MTREQAIRAVQGGYERAIATLDDVFCAGLATGEPVAVLAERYDRGFAIAVEANKAALEEVEAYFAGKETS